MPGAPSDDVPKSKIKLNRRPSAADAGAISLRSRAHVVRSATAHAPLDAMRLPARANDAREDVHFPKAIDESSVYLARPSSPSKSPASASADAADAQMDSGLADAGEVDEESSLESVVDDVTESTFAGDGAMIMEDVSASLSDDVSALRRSTAGRLSTDGVVVIGEPCFPRPLLCADFDRLCCF